MVMRLFQLGDEPGFGPPLGDEERADAIAKSTARMVAGEEPKLGPYLRDYDPDGNDGAGEWKWTGNKKHARVFANVTEGWECWRAVSTKRPVRIDGKPNRPLTRFNVTFEPAEGAS